MTVAIQTPYQPSTGNGVATFFAFSFKILDAADLLVYVDGALKTLNVDYTVAGVSNPAGGSVTFTTAPANLAAVRIIRAMTRSRTTDYQQLGDFLTPVVNPDFDKAVLLVQDLGAQLGRAIGAPVYEPDALMALPPKATRAGKFVSFDANGDLQLATSIGANALSGSIIGAFLFDISAAETAAGLVVGNLNRLYVWGDVRRYGAALDNVTDDSVALQRWLNVGGYLTWPIAATAKITAELNPASTSRIIAAAGSTIRQTTANLNVMSALAKVNIIIDGLTFQAVGSMTSYFNGCGFHANGCTNVHLRNCTVTGHRGWGIQFYNSNECSAISNRLINSPVTNADNHTQCAGDIAMSGSSSRNVVSGNVCISGNGIGISVHSLLATDHADSNTVTGNIIQNCRIYGGEQYQNDPAGTVSGNVFANNTVENISGAVQQITFGYVYGAGFYAVGADNFVVTGNRFKNTHSAGVVFVDLLAPGAIGVTNCGQGSISNNTIDTEGMFGITVRDPGALGIAKQKVNVFGNVLSNITRDGIQVLEKANVAVFRNAIDGTAGAGVRISNSVTKRSDVSVCFNSIKNSTLGVWASYTRRSAFDGNLIETMSVHGMSLDNNDDFSVTGNKVFGHVTYGIYIDTSNGAHTIDANMVDGNGTAAYGIYFDAKGNLSQTNRATGCTTANFFGVYNPKPAATPVTGTWAQGDEIAFAGPAAGAFRGAICTAGGSPGTWKTVSPISP